MDLSAIWKWLVILTSSISPVRSRGSRTAVENLSTRGWPGRQAFSIHHLRQFAVISLRDFRWNKFKQCQPLLMRCGWRWWSQVLSCSENRAPMQAALAGAPCYITPHHHRFSPRPPPFSSPPRPPLVRRWQKHFRSSNAYVSIRAADWTKWHV